MFSSEMSRAKKSSNKNTSLLLIIYQYGLIYLSFSGILVNKVTFQYLEIKSRLTGRR